MSTPEEQTSLSASAKQFEQDLASAVTAEECKRAATDEAARIEKRKRLLHLAKYRAIGILNDNRERNIFRARASLLSDFTDWKVYPRGDFAFAILRAASAEEFTEDFINGFN